MIPVAVFFSQVLIGISTGTFTTIQFLFAAYPTLTFQLNDFHSCQVGMQEMRLTPLQLAAACGQRDILRFLLSEAIVDVNQVCPDNGRTALHIAVSMGQTKATEVLCGDSRVDINAEDYSGLTSLHDAVEAQNIHIIKILLQRPEAALCIADKNRATVFHKVAKNPNVQIMNILICHALNSRENFHLCYRGRRRSASLNDSSHTYGSRAPAATADDAVTESGTRVHRLKDLHDLLGVRMNSI